MPGDRSFSDIVNGVRPPLANSGAASQNGRPFFEKSAPKAVRLSRRSTVLSVAVAVIGLSMSVYCAAGFVHYKRVAQVELSAAQRAERTNADLQVALDRLRDSSAGARTGIDAIREPLPAIGQLDVGVNDRAAVLGQAFGSLDSQVTDTQPMAIAALSPDRPTTFAHGYLQRAWARITLDQSVQNLQQLNAEYDALVSERDQLQQRVKELEQKLTLVEQPQAAPQTARASQDPAQKGAASIAFPAAPAAVGPSAEPASPVFKNFNAPASAPNYFSNESGAILGNPNAAADRR